VRSLRFGLRRLLVRPWWALVFVLLIGGTAGAVSALFAVCDQFLFAPLSYANVDSIVHFDAPFEAFRNRDDAERTRRIALESTLVQERAFAKFTWVVQPGGEAATDWGLKSTAVSASLFDLLGVRPERGRFFSESETSSTPRPAVLGYALWRDRFGSNPDVVGQDIEIPGTLDGRPWRILGIMPRGFSFPSGTNFWVPFDPARQPPTFAPDFARLSRGVTVSTLHAQLPGINITTLTEYLRPDEARALEFLLVITALLLMSAWIHGASLLLSRSAATIKTLAIRIALGATHAQLRGDLAGEGFWLALGSLAVCLVIAIIAMPLIVAWLPPEVTSEKRTTMSLGLLASSVACTALGVVAWVMVSGDVIARAKMRSSTQGFIRSARWKIRPQLLLVLLQAGVASVLLYATIASAISYRNLAESDLGFEPRGLLAIPLPMLGQARIQSIELARALAEENDRRTHELASQIRMLPGVSEVAFATARPMTMLPEPISMTLDDSQDLKISVRRLVVTRGYVRAVGAHITEGREPSADETLSDPRARPLVQAVLVNEALARRLRPQGSIVGRSLRVSTALSFLITGTITDVKHGDLDAQTDPTVYAFLPENRTGPTMLVRADDANATLVSVRKLLPGAVASKGIVSLESVVKAQTAGPRARVQVLGTVGIIALVLLGVGLTASVGEVIQQKRRTIAVLFSLGAPRRTVVLDCVRQTSVAAGIGLTAGIWAGYLILKWAGSVIYGVRPLAWSAVVLTVAPCLAVAATAAWVAARNVDETKFAQFLRE